jgi:hypothetical protein
VEGPKVEGLSDQILDKAIDAVLGGIKSKAISIITDYFFPPAGPDYDSIWANIKARVEKLCKELISDEYAHQLELRV